MSTERTRFRCTFVVPLCLLAAIAWLPGSACAQGFAAMVSPPRFELAGRPGQTQRQVVEITNADAAPASYRLRTADWTLDENGTVKLSDALADGSCRPWVAIERREITVPGNGRFRFRFEVTPPADASGECRFALMLQGGGGTAHAGPNLDIPLSAQIAIIVYVTLGDAAPKLEVVGTEVAMREGRQVPLIRVRNTGDAHGRLEGFLEGTDASGRKLEFTPSGLPILAGETRAITLDVAGNGDTRPTVTFPVEIRGTLEWNGRTTPLEARFAP